MHVSLLSTMVHHLMDHLYLACWLPLQSYFAFTTKEEGSCLCPFIQDQILTIDLSEGTFSRRMAHAQQLTCKMGLHYDSRSLCSPFRALAPKTPCCARQSHEGKF